MDVDCSVDPVNNGESEAVEVLLNAGEPVSTGVKDGDIPVKNVNDVSNVCETVENDDVAAAGLFSSSAQCDVNSNFRQRAKTKGMLRQQLRKKRQQHQQSISNSVTTPAVKHSRKKTVSLPNRAVPQVTSYVAFLQQMFKFWL